MAQTATSILIFSHGLVGSVLVNFMSCSVLLFFDLRFDLIIMPHINDGKFLTPHKTNDFEQHGQRGNGVTGKKRLKIIEIMTKSFVLGCKDDRYRLT